MQQTPMHNKSCLPHFLVLAMPTSPEWEALRRLRRESRQLKIEREILAKAAAWFARETESANARRDAELADKVEVIHSRPRIHS